MSDRWCFLFFCSLEAKNEWMLCFGFIAPTGSCCSAACTPAPSGLTPCSLETTASPPCKPTGNLASTTTITDTYSTSAAAMMTTLCWRLDMTVTSFPSACFPQRSCRKACRERRPRCPHPGSVNTLLVVICSVILHLTLICLCTQTLW